MRLGGVIICRSQQTCMLNIWTMIPVLVSIPGSSRYVDQVGSTLEIWQMSYSLILRFGKREGIGTLSR
jgi:hypothetical protein